jgi:oligopeptide transport system permease protein
MSDFPAGSRARPGQERFVAPLEETPLLAVDAIDVDAVPESQWREAWKRLRKAPLFWVSSFIILVLAVVIAFPGLFTDVDPNFKQLSESFSPPREGHPFGFNQQGGDVWARTLYGARASVAVGVLTTLLVAVVGIVTGSIAGYYGGWLDSCRSRSCSPRSSSSPSSTTCFPIEASGWRSR